MIYSEGILQDRRGGTVLLKKKEGKRILYTNLFDLRAQKRFWSK